MSQSDPSGDAAGGALAGSWLVFALGGTEYAMPVERVREIIGLLPITRVPRLPASVRGVVNLRGRVVPVVDLRIRFGLEAVDHGGRTCIIVVHAAGIELGVVVDRVSEVVRIAGSEVAAPPRFGPALDTGYLLGVARHGERVRLLLDVDRAVSPQELDVLAAAAEPAA